MAHLTMDQAIAKLREENPKYAPAAYHFIRRALDFSLRKLKRQDADRPAHVSGKELLEGFRDLALEEYGPLAKTVLEDWGITRCAAVGEIVFQRVNLGVLGKNDSDKIDDFEELWSFAEAFDMPFQPQMVTPAPKRVTPRRESSSPASTNRNRSSSATTPSEKE
jgi:uncharacterized repeat protein (TIGR04138 family)